MKLRVPLRLRTNTTEPTQNSLSSPTAHGQKTLSLVQRAQDKQTQDFYTSIREKSSSKLRVPPRLRSDEHETTQNSSSSSAKPFPKTRSLVQWAQDKQTRDFHRYIRTQKSPKTLLVPLPLRSNNMESTSDPSSSSAKPSQNTSSLVQWAHDKQSQDFHHAMRAQMALSKLFETKSH